MKDVRLGLIGAGYWGRILARSVLEVPGLVLASVATTNPSSLNGIVPAECQVTGDWRSMLSAGIDGVIIATPPALHREMACAALQKHLAVFVEKPLALTVADAIAMEQDVDEAAGILHVDHTDLFSPAWSALKARLPDIGTIQMVEARMGGPGPVRPDTSPLWDWGPHPMAACIDLFGAPVAFRKLEEKSRNGPDGLREVVTIQMEFAAGGTARIVTGNDFRVSERNVTVTGSRGVLRYDDKALHKLASIKGSESVPIPVAGTKPLAAGLARFESAIRAGGPSWQDARLGAVVVSVLAAVDG